MSSARRPGLATILLVSWLAAPSLAQNGPLQVTYKGTRTCVPTPEFEVSTKLKLLGTLALAADLADPRDEVSYSAPPVPNWIPLSSKRAAFGFAALDVDLDQPAGDVQRIDTWVGTASLAPDGTVKKAKGTRTIISFSPRDGFCQAALRFKAR